MWGMYNLAKAYRSIEQERSLKHRNNLGGLEISLRHQLVNTLELSAPTYAASPPPTKKKPTGEVSNNKYM